MADEMRRRTFEVDGGVVAAVEAGDGPPVVLVHGFPETSLSWRRQLPAIAAAGFHAVAIDVRGYGGSLVPEAVEDYRMVRLVDDVAAVVEQIDDGPAVVIGHDWGSPIAANTALLRPDVVRAVGLLSVPYAPRGGPRPSEAFAAMGGDAEFYVPWFQHPGRAEAEIEADLPRWLGGFYAALSADTMTSEDGAVFFIPPGGRMADGFPADGVHPAWLGDDDLAEYVASFTRTGMTGALNRYRNMDRDWADLAPLDDAPIPQPSIFIGGTKDASTTWMRAAIEAFPQTLPGLSGSHLLDCGHWVQQERPDAVNALLVEWLRTLPA